MVDPAVEQAWAAGTRADGTPEGRPRRRLRRRRRARRAAPAVRALLAQGPVRPRLRQHAGTVPAAREPGIHPRGRRTRTSAACTSRRPKSSRARRCSSSWTTRRCHARAREDGQEPEERGRPRRHLPRLRRRHVAAVRDVHGPARNVAAVEHRRHHRRAPLPAAPLAQRHRRRDRRRRASTTNPPTTPRADCCTRRSTPSATTCRRWRSTRRSRGCSS